MLYSDFYSLIRSSIEKGLVSDLPAKNLYTVSGEEFYAEFYDVKGKVYYDLIYPKDHTKNDLLKEVLGFDHLLSLCTDEIDLLTRIIIFHVGIFNYINDTPFYGVEKIEGYIKYVMDENPERVELDISSAVTNVAGFMIFFDEQDKASYLVNKVTNEKYKYTDFEELTTGDIVSSYIIMIGFADIILKREREHNPSFT